MSFRDKFKIVSSNMTSSDLAVAIEDDARDTSSKLLPIESLFLQILGSENTDDLTQYIDDIYNNYGSSFTVCAQDGDLLLFQCDDSGNLINKWYDGEEYHDIPIVQQGYITADIADVDNELMCTTQGTYNWSLYQLCSSLSAQMQSSVTMQRLANLATNPSLTISDVNTVLNDLNGKVTPELDNIIKSIKMIPGGINQSSLTNILHQVYASFINATAIDDTIEFDDTTYAVKSFNGTVVWDVITSGAQMLSGILLVAGGVVAKIIGAAGLLATSIIPRVASAAGISEKTTYDENCSQYELSSPIFQMTTSVINSDLASYVNDCKVVKMVNPVMNIYTWKNQNENFYRTAGYLNLLNKNNLQDLSYSYFGVPRKPVTLAWDNENRLSIKVFCDVEPSGPTLNTCKLADALSFDAAGNNENFGLFESSDDTYIRDRICRSMAYVLYQCFQLQANWTSYLSTGIEIVSSGSSPSTHSSIVSAWVDRIKDNIDNDVPVLISDMLGCLIACNDCFTPNWTFIINYVLPYISQELVDHQVVNYYTTGDNVGNGKGSIISTALPAVNFRGSFAVVPPNYEQGSALKALLITLAAAAVVAVAVIATKTVIHKQLARTMTDKYINIQREWENLKNNYGSDNYVSLRNAYLKHVRKYNLLAKLTGYSTLSSVQGWESGNSTDSRSSDGFMSDVSQNAMVNSILGIDETSDNNISLAVIMKTITGHSY